MTAQDYTRLKEDGYPPSAELPVRPLAEQRRSTFNKPQRADQRQAQRIARALGWFSVGLGLVEIAAPRAVARAIGLHPKSGGPQAKGLGRLSSAALASLPSLGVSHTPAGRDHLREVLSAFGVRELATGLAILSQPAAARWIWTRVFGDVVDLAFLALQSRRAEPRRLATAAGAVAGVAALDVYAARRLSEVRSPSRTLHADGSLRIVESIAIHRSPEDCYAAWRELTNLPHLMSHVESVQTTTDRLSHWKVTGPAGTDVEWDAEIVVDDPAQLLVWRSVPGSEIENEGSVRFQPGPRGLGTLLRVSLRYQPPAGTLGAFVATLFGEEPELQMRDDLRRFKQFLETGEILTTEGQPAGPPRGIRRGPLRIGHRRQTATTESREPEPGRSSWSPNPKRGNRK
jgi:uncharacterized membrane protein